MDFLYRGVSEALYKELGGKLIPKKVNENFAQYACAGAPHAQCGSGIICGKSIINNVILHQWGQKGYPTSGISTTPYRERAVFYACSGEQNNNGIIYGLSVARLKEAGVSIYCVNELVPHPAVLEDDEHILVAQDFGSIPEFTVVTIEFVGSSI